MRVSLTVNGEPREAEVGDHLERLGGVAGGGVLGLPQPRDHGAEAALAGPHRVAHGAVMALIFTGIIILSYMAVASETFTPFVYGQF